MNRPTLSSPQRPWTALALALLAGSAGAQGFSAETFGQASGDVPLRGLGLVLELVDAAGQAPRLRLLGGAPGHPAAILVSPARAEAPWSGPRGTSFLVPAGTLAIEGAFDGHGIFETALPDPERFPAGRDFFAQGVHTGILHIAGGPLVQASQGLAFQRRPAPATEALGFDDLLPHLPVERSLEAAAGLPELLQTALDSAGDSLRLAVELEASVGLGIEVADVKVGGKVGGEFTVTRLDDGRYEVAVGADLCTLAGVSAGTGAEAGIEAAMGGGSTRIFRFHSAPGAARGILGILLSIALPGGPADLIGDGGLMVRAAERTAELQETVQALRAQADAIERELVEVLEGHVASAEAAHAVSRARLAAAQSALATAAWHQVPARAAQVAVQRARFELTRALLLAACSVRDQGRNALAAIRVSIESAQAQIASRMEGMARAGRIAAALVQLRPFAVAHEVGGELRVASVGELEAKFGLPFVDVKGLESSLKATCTRGAHLRYERETRGGPLHLAVAIAFEREVEAVGAHVTGFEVARGRTVEVVQSFVRRPSGWRSAGASLELALDTRALWTVGMGVQHEQGVGRAWSVSVHDELMASAGGLESLGSIDSLLARCGALELAFQLQDRRQTNLDFGFSVDVSGNGGGLEIEAEWADQGRLLSRATTVADGIQRVMEGGGQAIDPVRSAVVALD